MRVVLWERGDGLGGIHNGLLRHHVWKGDLDTNLRGNRKWEGEEVSSQQDVKPVPNIE